MASLRQKCLVLKEEQFGKETSSDAMLRAAKQHSMPNFKAVHNWTTINKPLTKFSQAFMYPSCKTRTALKVELTSPTPKSITRDTAQHTLNPTLGNRDTRVKLGYDVTDPVYTCRNCDTITQCQRKSFSQQDLGLCIISICPSSVLPLRTVHILIVI